MPLMKVMVHELFNAGNLCYYIGNMQGILNILTK